MGASPFFLADDALPGTPSAIAAMLAAMQQATPGRQPSAPPSPPPAAPQGLLGGPDASMPVAPPQAVPAGSSPQKRSLIDRISDRFRPKAPMGYEGLLSQQEIESARPGLLHSLIRAPDEAPAADRYQAKLDHMVALKEHVAQLAAQKQQQEARAAIAQRFAVGDNAPPEQVIASLKGMLAEFARIGDTEMVGKLGNALNIMGAKSSSDTAKWEDFGGYKALVAPDGTELKRVSKTPSPRDPNAPDSAELNRDQKMFDRTNRLADDYRSETKEIAKAADSFRTMTSLADAAKRGDAASQIGLVYGFMHGLDPSSTVREGEYATAQNAAGVDDKIRNQYNKLLKGGFLTPQQVDSFLAVARNSAKGWQQRQKNLHALYRQRAARWKINPDDVLLDYFDGIDMAGAAADKGSNVRSALGSIK